MSSATPLVILQPSLHQGDPQEMTDDPDTLSLRAAMYESLVRRDLQGRIVPALAQQWEISEDARQWTFHLHQGVRFHDGQTLSAGDVLFSLERGLAPDRGGELGTTGVLASYFRGASWRELDQGSVQTTLAEPNADLLSVLLEIPILSRRAVERDDIGVAGSGPFRLKHQGPREILMELFPSYREELPISSLLWREQPDPEKREHAWQREEADLVSCIRPVRGVGEGKTLRQNGSLCMVLFCNFQGGALRDIKVRQALNWATDREELVKTVLGGAGIPLGGPLSPWHYGFDPSIPTYGYDPERARQLLAEAGHADGLALTMMAPTSQPVESPRLAVALKGQWAKLRIQLEIRYVSPRELYAEQVRAKRFGDLCLFDSSPLSSSRVLREKFQSNPPGPWWQGWHSQEVDAWLGQAAATPNDEARQGLYRKAYRCIVESAPWIFLYRPAFFWGLGERLSGWGIGPDRIARFLPSSFDSPPSRDS
ncbi:MAG: ABC transporter substrate-binding protein [bacterium]